MRPAPEKVVIGNAELWLGDCRDVLPQLDNCDLMLTDPPYGIKQDKGMGGGGFDGTGKYRRKPRRYRSSWDDCPPDAELLDMVIQSARYAVLWGGNYFQLPRGGKWLVWDKQQVMPSYSDAELAWTNLPGVSVKLLSIHCNKARIEMGLHPTQKPLDLMKWCISLAPDPHTICDAFMGSGTTGVAAMRMGKAFVGIERDPEYFAKACERIDNAQRQGSLLASPGLQGAPSMRPTSRALRMTEEV